MKILLSCTGFPTEFEEGDVIIIKAYYFFYFYYVVRSECKLIEKVKTIKIMQRNIKHGIVFEYSSMVPRKGIIEDLQFFIGIFKKNTTVGLLQNALNILLYKEDKWNVSILQSLLLTEEFKEEKASRRSFVDFLDNQARDFYCKQIKNGSSVSDAYRLTKTAYPKNFNLSLKLFKAAFPEKSIYEDLDNTI